MDISELTVSNTDGIVVNLERLQLTPFDYLVEFIALVIMLQSEAVTPEEFA